MGDVTCLGCIDDYFGIFRKQKTLIHSFVGLGGYLFHVSFVSRIE